MMNFILDFKEKEKKMNIRNRISDIIKTTGEKR